MGTMSIDRSILSQVELADLIERESPTRFGKPAGTGVKRTVKGACPWCGGTDRFAVFIAESIQRYVCGIHGHGCGKHGDAIQFLRDYKGVSFSEAVALLGGESETFRKRSRWAQERQGNDYTTDQWQKRIAESCQEATARLWTDEGQVVLDYLRERGLTEETIHASHLGMVMYKGANIAKNEQHTVPCLVIPWYSNGQYWRVTLRDIRPESDKRRRYENVGGSALDEALYLADSLSLKRAVVMVEGELDALSIVQEAGELVSVVATGSTHGSRSMKWLVELATLPHVFIAFDAEEKAEQSADYWLKALDNATRWRPPIGKDANEMLTQGLNITLWVRAALSTLFPPVPARPKPAIQEEPELVCSVCGIRAEDAADFFYDEQGTPLCHLHVGAESLPLAANESDDFMNAVQRIAAVFGPGCTISEPMRCTPQEYIARRQAELDEEARPRTRQSVARPNRERLPWWLVPGDPEWNRLVDRCGLAEMQERRKAWFDQSRASYSPNQEEEIA